MVGKKLRKYSLAKDFYIEILTGKGGTSSEKSFQC